MHLMRDAVAAAYERIRPYVRETPAEESEAMAEGGAATVYLKLEHLQHTGSFKFRGACNKIALLTPSQAEAGVVAASNGNHGLGVAAAARARGIAAEVYVSAQVSPAKARRIAAHGATLRQAGNDPLAAELAARTRGRSLRPRLHLALQRPRRAGRPGHPGAGTPPASPGLDAVFVAVGGGGLIGGIGSYLKSVSPNTEVVGCWPENSPVLHECLRAGRVIDVAEQPTLSESTAGGLEPDSVTLPLCQRAIDRSVLVSEEQIRAAMRLVLQTEHWLIEGAAAVAVAAFRQEIHRWDGKRVAIVLCGRNVSPEVLAHVL